jgi:hypothetical protein
VQVIAQQRHDDSWRPTVEWANLRYEVTDTLAIRGGRVVLPLFSVTDSRRLGYAYAWVRPPAEVYSLVPITNSDGLDASWRAGFGDASLTLQGHLGRSESRYPGATAEARRLALATATLERGPLTLRGSFGRSSLTVDAYDALLDPFRAFGPQGVAIAERYVVRDRRVEFAGLGATWDPETWFLTGEWARFDTHSLLGARSAWYLSVGARLRKLTPYATYAQTRPRGTSSDPGLDTTGLPPPALFAAQALNAALNAQLALTPSQQTLSIGLRWDFVRNAALKLQVDEVRLEPGSAGLFGNLQPGFERGGRVRLFSAAVDFVF